MNLTDIIQAVPSLLTFYVPGYLGVSIFQSLSKKGCSESHKHVLSCVSSYLAVTLINLICPFNNPFVVAAMAIALCIFGSIAVAAIPKAEWLRSFLANKLQYSTSVTALDDAFEEQDRDSMITVILRESGITIDGKLCAFGDLNSNPWVSIGYFQIYPDNSTKEYTYSFRYDDERIIVNLTDVEYSILYPNK